MPRFVVLPAGQHAVAADDAQQAAARVAHMSAGDLVVVDAEMYEALLACGRVFHVTRETRVSEAS